MGIRSVDAILEIEDSDIALVGPGIGAIEPKNDTREYGLEVKYRF